VIGDKTSIDKRNSLLSSVVWDLTPLYSEMVEDLKADKFGTHEYSLQLADNSIKLLHTKNIPDDVWSELEGIRAKIVDGSLKVERIEDAEKVRALMNEVTPAPQ
jgi:simple sugar transport system substrate-binding protein